MVLRVILISTDAPLAKKLLNEDGETDFVRIYMKKELSGEIVNIF